MDKHRQVLEQIARMTLDGEGGWQMSIDDAFSTVHSVITMARRALQPEVVQNLLNGHQPPRPEMSGAPVQAPPLVVVSIYNGIGRRIPDASKLEARNTEIRRLYREGRTLQELSSMRWSPCGTWSNKLGTYRLEQIIGKENLRGDERGPAYRKRVRERLIKVATLIDQGLAIPDIATELGVSRARVYQMRKRLAWRRRIYPKYPYEEAVPFMDGEE